MDGSGNVYLTDNAANAIKEWSAATRTVSTLLSSGIADPFGVAVDGAGNVYIADTYDNALKQWNPSTQTLSTLLAPAAGVPSGVAVDSADNLYILGVVPPWAQSTSGMLPRRPSAPWSPPDLVLTRRAWRWMARATSTSPMALTKTIKEWNASTQTLSAGPLGIQRTGGRGGGCRGQRLRRGTADHAGSGASPTFMVGEWNAATQTFSILVSSGLSFPQGVAVDAAGNVYIADTAATRSRSGTPPRSRSAPWFPQA